MTPGHGQRAYSIHIRTDGAMDRDTRSTGGTGFVIDFPDSLDLEPIQESFRRDHQGIHRLEMIAIIEGMEQLLRFSKMRRDELRQASGVTIHTDRHSLSDSELTNPWKIAAWRRNNWHNHEGKPIKDKDLLDQIDKLRKKVSDIYGRTEIVYERRQRNKRADKLAKQGKRDSIKSRKLVQEKTEKIAPRKYVGPEISYQQLTNDESLDIRVYRKDQVSDEVEITAEICDGIHFGKTIKIYIDSLSESDLHRHHYYRVTLDGVFSRHVRIATDFEELSTDN